MVIAPPENSEIILWELLVDFLFDPLDLLTGEGESSHRDGEAAQVSGYRDGYKERNGTPPDLFQIC